MTMKSPEAKLNRLPPRRIRVQAALWVTELHGPDRNAAIEARVKQWIAEDPLHAEAFELATDAWQRSGNLPGSLSLSDTVDQDALQPRRLSRPMLAVVAALIVGLATMIYMARDNTLSTGAGEQRSVALNDGTEVSLNANSRVIVQYDDKVRRVQLVRGEASFNVVKHQPRPFVVVVGDRKVVAVGTSFMVRKEDSSASGFAVTLVEGRVAVEPVSGPDILPIDITPGLKLLNPGQRLRVTSNAADSVDSPNLERVTAWQRGQLIFDDTPLQEAVTEFNSYASKTLVLEDAELTQLRVGGVFRIGDPASFALAIADTYHLSMSDNGKTITLSNARPVQTK